jgi:hypothetical protein
VQVACRWWKKPVTKKRGRPKRPVPGAIEFT